MTVWPTVCLPEQLSREWNRGHHPTSSLKYLTDQIHLDICVHRKHCLIPPKVHEERAADPSTSKQVLS